MRRFLQTGLIVSLVAVMFPSATHAGQFIFGASAGSNTVKIDEDFDESEFAWKAFAGFRFWKYFGVEAQYADWGNPEAGTAQVDANNLGFFAIGIWPIHEHFEAFGKFGYHQWNVEFDDGAGEVFEEDEWDIAWGAGIGIPFADHFAIRMEYERYEVEDTDSVAMLSAGIDFRFGDFD
jgi:OOP family OmpA-OmpF porin